MTHFFSGKRSFWRPFVITLAICAVVIYYEFKHYTTSPLDIYILQLSSGVAKHQLYGLIRNGLIVISLLLAIGVGLLWWHPRKRFGLVWNIVVDVVIIAGCLLAIYITCLIISDDIRALINQMSNALPTELLHKYVSKL